MTVSAGSRADLSRAKLVFRIPQAAEMLPDVRGCHAASIRLPTTVPRWPPAARPGLKPTGQWIGQKRKQVDAYHFEPRQSLLQRIAVSADEQGWDGLVRIERVATGGDRPVGEWVGRHVYRLLMHRPIEYAADRSNGRLARNEAAVWAQNTRGFCQSPHRVLDVMQHIHHHDIGERIVAKGQSLCIAHHIQPRRSDDIA